LLFNVEKFEDELIFSDTIEVYYIGYYEYCGTDAKNLRGINNEQENS
jgi:hypothetical protein